MITHAVSLSLLSAIWNALREPVRPLESLQIKDALKRCRRRAEWDGPKPFDRYCYEAIFLIQRSTVFNPQNQREFLGMLLPAGPEESVLGLLDHPLARLAVVCAKLEMMGFEIDSEPFWRLILSPFERPVSAWFEQRHTALVSLTANTNGHQKLRTLRTRRGFIIQAQLDVGHEPQKVDIYGPRYKHARDWMEVLSGDGAWTVEFRDAAGYNPGKPASPAELV